MSSAEEKAKSGTAACSRGWPARWLCAGGVSRAQAASKGGGLQRAERKAAWSPGVTRGCHGEQEVAGGRPERWAALRRAGGAETEKQRGKHEVEEGWTYLQFPKTPATSL